MNHKLSPSDLTFLYEGCKRCFYLKVVHNIPQPSIPLPSIFSKMAGLLKSYYDGKRTRKLHADLPPGTVIYGEKYVKSKIIQLPDHKDTCFISGRFDIVVRFDDGTYGVIDFKIGKPNEDYTNLYSRQLQAYTYALEHAAQDAKLILSPITRIGLLYFYPSSVSQKSSDMLSFDSEIHWIEMKKDERGFLKFIGKVLNVLESPTPPKHSPGCQWCEYYSRLKDLR
jgi:hypothetical protein